MVEISIVSMLEELRFWSMAEDRMKKANYVCDPYPFEAFRKQVGFLTLSEFNLSVPQV